MSCCDNKQPTFATGTVSSAACAPGALPGGLSRPRFFDGMLVTQVDLDQEQRYWRVKRRLTNRALGTGTVWGLRLRWDPKRRSFALAPGYALDCCGNDLVVDCPVEVSEAELIALADPAVFQSNAATSSKVTRASVVLQYVECAEDGRPVHADACSPPSSRCEPSRVRETTRLLLVPPPMAGPPTCLDDAFADLAALRASITDPKLLEVLFPPAPPATATGSLSTSTGAQLPVTLHVTSPGATADFNQALPANGSASGSITATHTPDGSRAAVIQFELRPSDGWSFSAGAVRDGSTVVDEVTPPADLMQFWSVSLAMPVGPNGVPSSVTQDFSYTVDGLALQQLFDARAAGVAQMTISGRATASPGDNGSVGLRATVNVSVTSTVGTAEPAQSCLSHLSYGFMADPRSGANDLKLLLLAVVYAYFTDVTARSGGASTKQSVLASKLYTAAWLLLGVNIDNSSLPDDTLAELAKILATLFQCWCDAMLYAGPRCASEHHGVYLGSATVSRTGQILSFDMWEGRRQVLTGPLVEHWLGVFGLAAPDVVAARLAQTICCVAGQPLPTLAPPSQGGVITHGGPGANSLSLGRGSVTVRAANAPAPTGPATSIGLADLVARLVGGLVADDAAPVARFTTTLPSGAVIEATAPAASAPSAARDASLLAAPLAAALGRQDALPPLAAVAARAAITEVAHDVAGTAVPGLGAPAQALAKQLGLPLASLVAAGAEGILAAAPAADPAAVDELAARATDAFAALADGVAAALRKTKSAKPSALLRDAAVRKAAVPDLAKRLGLAPDAVTAALDRGAASVL